MAYRRIFLLLLIIVHCEGFERRSREGLLRDLQQTVADRLGHRFGKRVYQSPDLTVDRPQSSLFLDLFRETRDHKPQDREYIGNTDIEYRRKTQNQNDDAYPTSFRDEFIYRFLR